MPRQRICPKHRHPGDPRSLHVARGDPSPEEEQEKSWGEPGRAQLLGEERGEKSAGEGAGGQEVLAQAGHVCWQGDPAEPSLGRWESPSHRQPEQDWAEKQQIWGLSLHCLFQAAPSPCCYR